VRSYTEHEATVKSVWSLKPISTKSFCTSTPSECTSKSHLTQGFAFWRWHKNLELHIERISLEDPLNCPYSTCLCM
jgi:hypothetical protein